MGAAVAGDGHDGRYDGEERRTFPRFALTLAGMCSVAGGADVPCTVMDMSMGGVALRAEVDSTVGEAVIVALPQIGLLRGRVARVFAGGFAVAFEQGRAQRERVASYLTWVVASRLDPELEERTFERIVPFRRVVAISVAGKPTVAARIVDMSRSGVALTATATVSLGDPVTVGGTRAVVVRLLEGGFAARFVEPLGPGFDATIIL